MTEPERKHDFIAKSVTFPNSCVQCGWPADHHNHTDVVRRDGVPSEIVRLPKES